MDGEADLSRRCISYEMQGLSFREYIEMFHHHHFNQVDLDEILFHGNEVCSEVNSKIRPVALFNQYLQQGYYPFLIEGSESYYTRIENVVNMTIESELPQLRKIDVEKLSSVAGIARTTLLQYLQYLNDSRLINLLYSDNTSIKRMQKPDKIYIENANLLHVLSPSVNPGTEREVFFVNQLSMGHQVEYSKTAADFTIDRFYTFEVGGHSKGQKQLSGVPNGYIAAADEEYVIGNKIPLWLFGFLY